jgi:F-type H+-transporting ATPase subunit b
MKSTVSRFPFPVSRLLAVTLLALATAGMTQAQEPKTAPAQKQQQGTQAQQQPGINQQFGQPLAAESAKAAQSEAHESDQEKTAREFKQSASVRWMAKHLHISTTAGYWVGYILNFAILALLIIVALKKNLPSAFRSRTANIQRGIAEARKASEEANSRLAEIEARLAELNNEVAAMRASSEKEAAADEQHIVAAAEEDKRRIVEAAESEIAAAAKQARHQLKTFTADLAVSLAEHRIHVDSATDTALVRSFTEQLAKPAGKDGQ